MQERSEFQNELLPNLWREEGERQDAEKHMC